jgi:uncharacterized protein (TIGR03437 family)
VLKYTADAGATETLSIGVLLRGSSAPITPPGHPVVFIPGVSGSFLTRTDPSDPAKGEELWPGGLLTDHYALSLFPGDSPSSAIQATDVIRKIEILGQTVTTYQPLYDLLRALGYREYQLHGDPSHTGCDLSQKSPDPSKMPNLFTFPYDWRKDNAIAAHDLGLYLGCVRQFYPNEKINLIAHSMGGLVARRYILDSGGPNVNALITIGTPWLGAPKLANVLGTGDFGVSPLVFDGTIQYLIPSFTGVHQLLPGLAYFELAGLPSGGGLPMRENGWDFNRNGISVETYTAPAFRDAIDLNFSRGPCPGPFCPADTGFAFHAYSNGGNQEDHWEKDTTGIPYYEIIGVQGPSVATGAANTISQVIPTAWTKCKTGARLGCSTKLFFDLAHGLGDGTVTLVSAARQVGTTADINAPGTSLDIIAIGTDDHTSQIGNLAVQNAIMGFLAQADGAANAASSSGVPTISPQGSPRVLTAEPSASAVQFVTVAQPYHYIRINGADAVAITDAAGHSTGPINAAATLAGSVAGVSVEAVGPRVTFATAPTTASYTLRFTTTTEPLALDFRTGTDSKVTHAVRYIDADVPAGVAAQLAIAPAGPAALRLDTKGDGSFSTTVNPNVNLTGTAAQDNTPPTIAISAAGRMLTVTAQDTGAGVKDIHVSDDGVNYTLYSAPIAVGNSVNTVFVFADDKAGNRAAAAYSFTRATPSINDGGVVSAATFTANAPVAPGGLASAFGANLGNNAAALTVDVGGFDAPVFAATSGQLNFQVPWQLAGQSQAPIVVSTPSVQSSPVLMPLAQYAPGIFSMASTGKGQGAIVISTTGELAAVPGAVSGFASRPARRGEFISIYATGLGPVTNRPATGAPASGNPLSLTTTPPVVTIGGAPASVAFSGLAPGFVGLYQINVSIPDTAPTGSDIAVTLTIGGVSSNTVTIAVQ